MRSRRTPRERNAWRLLSAALLCYFAGNLYFVYGPSLTVPSVADGCWLAFYGLALVAIGILTVARLRNSSTAWLDGSIAGLGAGALAGAFVFRHVATVQSGPWTVAATNLAYPVADITLIIMLVVIGHGLRGKDRSWWMLGVGFGTFLVGDLVCLYLTSRGTWDPFGVWEPVWPLAATLIGLAACSTSVIRIPRHSHQSYVVPMAFTLGAIALLLAGQWMTIPVPAVLLAVGALMLAALRGVLTLREVRSLAISRVEARVDYLTQLPNRRRLAEHLASTLTGQRVRTAILVIDLDRFKEINDSLGHVVGDRLLRRVGARLAEAKPEGALLARLGGDEFAVVLPDHDDVAACAVARRLLDALQPAFALTGVRVNVQASIGVAASPDHGRTGIELLRTADIAMYQAKKQQTGVAVYRLDDDNPSRPRLQRIAELRMAFAAGQFELYYQPQFDVATQRVTGVEALVRWHHPTDGIVAPDQFLPLLTQFGLIHDLTELVLEQACSAWSEFNLLGFAMRMSVNVSAADLSGTRLPMAFASLVERYAVPPGSIVIEVTEDAVIADHVHSREILGDLRRAGALISVDDYGTGQASLAYLRDLPLDELKLDRSFLRGTPDDGHNSAIVKSTIGLAHELGLVVVAEGVESYDAMQWLAGLGCDVCQGYYICRPMSFEALVDCLDESFDSDIDADVDDRRLVVRN